MIPLILLLLPLTINGCLLVRTTQCECLANRLDANFNLFVGEGLLKEGYIKSFPWIKSSDPCQISMYCLEGESLMIFDRGVATDFGAYSVDGICNPSTQQWSVPDDSGFSTFSRLDGLCLKEHKTPLPSKTCPCQIELIDDSNKDFNIAHYKFARPLTKPSTTLDANSCVTEYQCQGNTKGEVLTLGGLVRGPEKQFTLGCDANNTHNWKLASDGIYKFDYLYLTCYDTTIPETPFLCECDFQINIKKSSNNFLIRAQVSEDKCYWSVSCKGMGQLNVEIDKNLVSMDTVFAQCNRDTNQWRIESSAKNIWENVPELIYLCDTSTV